MFKDTLRLASRAAPLGAGLLAEKLFNSNVESLGDGKKLFRRQRLRMAFPISDLALVHADFISEHLLRSPALFAIKMNALS